MAHQRGRGAVICTALPILLFAAAGCSARYLASAPLGQNAPDLPGQSVTRHVVLVSIDGLRPDAIAAYATPTLQRLISEGSYTMHASTIMPSKTLPSHTSMLTGEPPERHGVLWNTPVTADTDRIEQPTVFGVARARGYGTAAFFSKPKFQPLQRADTLDYSQAPGGWFGGWTGRKTVTDVERYLLNSRPNLLFVHLPDPDRAGHAAGWMSPAYGRAVLDSDASVGRLLRAAETAFGAGNYTFIVTADHGGQGRDHGSADPLDVTIPWIAWGRGVKVGELESRTIRTMDTASTILWLLGVDEPTDWMGTPVIAAFAASPGPS
ncbi:MAG TPA: ectonucleotide pyrophosphatase/phosphodiesterase [Vicinamibacterales bacterium]|nr:ectonucleotide pyrophosphatase/phosphodiesterase [Vicinamibacterales bacterium]